MILSSRTLVPYLLDRGLVSASEVVDGDLSIADMSRRNRNFLVQRGNRAGLFLKQPIDWEPHSADTLRREAACYLLARDDAGFAALGELMPGFVDYDPGAAVLALEMLPGDETLAEYHRRVGDFPLEMAGALGTMLGSYHRDAGGADRAAGHAAAFPRGIPWVLGIIHHNPSHLGPVSAGAEELLRIIGRYPEYGAALDALFAGWRRETLVHGDLKWENCTVLPPEAGEAAPRLRIVDWELADFGDPCWDVGSLFQAYLTFWILSIRGADAAPPERLPSLAEVPLERMQPAIRAFWQAYVRTRGPGAAEGEVLRRSVLYAAARMIQTAWEYAVSIPRLTSNLLCILQVSMNVLARPDDAVRQLLGIEPPPAP